jgi:hypothetical protein
MELINQLDVQNPDHVSVITRDGRVTISIRKDGTDVTIGLPVSTGRVFNTSPRPPMQQPAPQIMAVSKEGNRTKPVGAPGTKHLRYGGATPKLNYDQVREIKLMLSDEDIMGKFTGITQACKEIGKAYNVSGCAIGNIARGIAWKEVKI